MERTVILFFVVLLVWGLMGCSTTKGTLLEKTTEREEKDSEVKIPSPRRTEEGYDPQEDYKPDIDFYEPEKEKKIGLDIRSTPSGVSVYLDNRNVGITPLVIADVREGRHKLTLKREGFYSKTVWITYTGGTAKYYFTLVEITGFLRVTAVPPEAQISLGSSWLPAGKPHEIAVGSHILRVRAFGYEEESFAVNIRMGRTTELSVVLKEVDFSLSNLDANRLAFNPNNSGLLGSIQIRFRVSGPGSGRAEIVDSQNRIVMSRDFGTFTTWEQSFAWDGRDRQRVPLPDGTYTVRIQAEGARHGERETAEFAVKIDSSIVLRFRSLWSGSAGLLYAPTPEILPRGSVQVSSVVLAHASSGAEGTVVRTPVNFGLRVGLDRRNLFELDTSAGGIIGFSDDTLMLPWFASAAFKASLLRLPGNFGLGTTAQMKLTYQDARTDTLANSSGLSLGLPTALHWGPLSLLLAPELILSPYSVSYDPDETVELDLYEWMYGRVGLLLDLPPFSFGASLSLRSLPFNEGFALDLPFQTALEAHWLIPKTQLFLSLYVAGDFESSDSYYLFGGAGLGILN
ncbi:MAG: PEGA domain-containing protein [Spirochaetaceae bacterium]|nr:MAG: PEGA domain-containing protein [Spirochaetaceae bacterium]